MARHFRCGTRMDGSGAGTAFSSPNRLPGDVITALSTEEYSFRTAADSLPVDEGWPEAGRGALPAGHPLSWGLLTAGTVLDGAAYTHSA